MVIMVMQRKEHVYVSNNNMSSKSLCSSSLITACGCHGEGAKSPICHKRTGKCSCWKRVGGRTCDQCRDGSYNLTNNGCSLCNCKKTRTVGGESNCDKVLTLHKCYGNIYIYIFILSSGKWTM